MRHFHQFLHLFEGVIYLAATVLALSGYEAAWACHALLGLMHLATSIAHEGIGPAIRHSIAKVKAWIAGQGGSRW